MDAAGVVVRGCLFEFALGSRVVNPYVEGEAAMGLGRRRYLLVLACHHEPGAPPFAFATLPDSVPVSSSMWMPSDALFSALLPVTHQRGPVRARRRPVHARLPRPERAFGQLLHRARQDVHPSRRVHAHGGLAHL